MNHGQLCRDNMIEHGLCGNKTFRLELVEAVIWKLGHVKILRRSKDVMVLIMWFLSSTIQEMDISAGAMCLARKKKGHASRFANITGRKLGPPGIWIASKTNVTTSNKICSLD
ncbi:hypothetical protein ACJX0J_032189 [Zea mays]